MRSLRYILLHQPVTVDDCLELAASAGQASVEVAPKVETFVGEDWVRTQLVAKLTWDVGGRRRRVHVVCGALREAADDADVRRAVAAANEKLARLLSRIAAAGVAVAGGGRVFTAEECEAVLAASGGVSC